MKQLQKYFSLNNSIILYVPSTQNVNEAADNAAEVEQVERFFGSTFGGFTTTEGRGGWVTDAGQLVTEAVVMVKSFCTDDMLQQHLQDVLDLAEKLKQSMSQEAVSLEVNGTIYFI